ncbi:MAG: GGDEF domain-containing protein [Candidatus Izemoplasma sp.]|nr:GGDEF domain-containing protein [Candidatus Izemoplasma sp.]
MQKYYDKQKAHLQSNYHLDILEDIVFARHYQVVGYFEFKGDDSVINVVFGDLSKLGFNRGPTLSFKTIFDHFDKNTSFAEVRGKQEYFDDFHQAIFNFEALPNETIPVRYNHERHWIRLEVVPTDADNIYAIFMTNITRFLAQEEDVFHKTHYDSLTGIFNKYTLDYHYGLRYKNDDFHVIYIDLDDFKEVNDTYGHPEGDRYLKAFAGILKSHESGYNLFYRIGGDEFVGLFFEDSKTVKTIAEDIIERTHALIPEDNKVQTSVSIGVVKATNRKDVIKKADNLMYEAKEQGKNTYLFEIEA